MNALTILFFASDLSSKQHIELPEPEPELHFALTLTSRGGCDENTVHSQ
jgi:hypothetical protein